MPIAPGDPRLPTQPRAILRALLASVLVVCLWTVLVTAVVWPYESQRMADQRDLTVLQMVLQPNTQQALVVSRRIPLHSPQGSSYEVSVRDLGQAGATPTVCRAPFEAVSLTDTPFGVVIGEASGVLRRPSAACSNGGEVLGRQDDGPPLRVACSANGRRLVSWGGLFVYLWDLPSGQLLRRFDRGQLNEIVLSADGERLFLASGASPSIAECSVETGEVFRTLPGGDDLAGIAVSPDGRLLASLERGGCLTLFDLETGAALWQRECRPDGCMTSILSFCPRGERLATAGTASHDSWTLAIWDVESGQRQANFTTQNRILGAAISMDGKAYSWGTEGSLCQWELSPGTPILADRRRSNWLDAYAPLLSVMP